MNDLNTKFTLMHLVRSWRWPWILFTMLIFLGLIKLGFWQLSRSDDKQQRLQKISELTTTQPLSLSQIVSIGDNINDLPVRLEGRFDNQQPILLDNQTHQGKLGYHVIQRFIDNLSGHQVLVNLGWVQGSLDRTILPSLSPITGTVSLVAHVRLLEDNRFIQETPLDATRWPMRIQQIEPEKIAQLINKDLLPFVVLLDKQERIGYQKNWQPVVMPPEKHRGYALQWFSLATAWLVLMIWASYNNLHNRQNNKNKGDANE
ncbi:SURF1 family protein [Thalassotalea aquiviva]|uniref:SURF1 family protein n=1 Tax=Thalassotalea aquiviva TaxID=3242415 RepID=UPI00352B7600